MKYALNPSLALAETDKNPELALSTALVEAQEFAGQQADVGIPADLTLNGTYLLETALGPARSELGFEPFTQITDGRDRGWFLTSSSAYSNRSGLGAGLVLLQNGEVGTYFKTRVHPDWLRIWGNIGMRGQVLYGAYEGNAYAESTEVTRRYRQVPSALPEGASAGQLATKIFLGLYQRGNYQEPLAS